jgi:hypothetical protein
MAQLVNKSADWSADELARRLSGEWAGKFTDLGTDLEAFNTEPVV